MFRKKTSAVAILYWWRREPESAAADARCLQQIPLSSQQQLKEFQKQRENPHTRHASQVSEFQLERLAKEHPEEPVLAAAWRHGAVVGQVLHKRRRSAEISRKVHKSSEFQVDEGSEHLPIA